MGSVEPYRLPTFIRSFCLPPNLLMRPAQAGVGRRWVDSSSKEKGPNEVGAGTGFQWSKAPEPDDLVPTMEFKLLERFRDIDLATIICPR